MWCPSRQVLDLILADQSVIILVSPTLNGVLCSQREQTQNWNIHILHSVIYLFWASINWSVSFWSCEAVCCNSEWICILEKGKQSSPWSAADWGGGPPAGGESPIPIAPWVCQMPYGRWKMHICRVICKRRESVSVCIMWKNMHMYGYIEKGESVCMCMHERGREKALGTDMRVVEWVLHSMLWSNLF